MKRPVLAHLRELEHSVAQTSAHPCPLQSIKVPSLASARRFALHGKWTCQVSAKEHLMNSQDTIIGCMLVQSVGDWVFVTAEWVILTQLRLPTCTPANEPLLVIPGERQVVVSRKIS